MDYKWNKKEDTYIKKRYLETHSHIIIVIIIIINYTISLFGFENVITENADWERFGKKFIKY